MIFFGMVGDERVETHFILIGAGIGSFALGVWFIREGSRQSVQLARSEQRHKDALRDEYRGPYERANTRKLDTQDPANFEQS